MLRRTSPAPQSSCPLLSSRGLSRALEGTPVPVWRALQRAASGVVRFRNAEGRPDRRESEEERKGNRRRGTRRRGAATAIEWRSVRPEPQAVVRSTLPKAEAEMSAPAARVVPRRRAPVRGGYGGQRHNAVESRQERVVPARGGERSVPPAKR